MSSINRAGRSGVAPIQPRTEREFERSERGGGNESVNRDTFERGTSKPMDLSGRGEPRRHHGVGELRKLFEELLAAFQGQSSSTSSAPSAPVSSPVSTPVASQPSAPVSTPVSTPTSPVSSAPGAITTSNDSVSAEDGNFLTQLAGSQWNTSGGGAMDCGPTSALMVLSSLGLVQHPDASNAASAIDSFRGVVDQYEGLGSSAGGDNTSGVTVAGLEGAIQSKGATTADLPVDGSNMQPTLDAIDQQLASGSKVIAYGDPSQAWESQLGGNYQEQGSFSHFVAVLGKSDDGNYLVGDPLSTDGVIEATPQQLAAYMQGGLQLDPPFGGAFSVSAAS